MKNVLVIGASGFAGRYLVRELSEQGYEIYAVQNKRPLELPESVKVIAGGGRSVNHKLLKAIQPEIIYHFARPKLPYFRWAGRLMAGYFAGWLNSRLVKEIGRSGLPVKLVYASGSLMYGPSLLPHDEDAPLNPFSFAKQYYRGELPILKAMSDRNFPVLVMRFPWLLGNGSWFSWFYLNTMKRTGAVPLFGQGTNFMEVIDVIDAVRMAIHFAENMQHAGIYNIVSSKPVTQLEFASSLSEVSGLPVKNHGELFQNRLETEAYRSFTSTILLSTKYLEMISGWEYTPLDQTLADIITEAGIMSSI